MNSHASSWSLVVACAHRLLRAKPEDAWSEQTREVVTRALLDRSDGVAAIERSIGDASASWTNTAAFAAWVEHVERMNRGVS